jgi:predicted RNA-binding Zn-ribbon protein involved in translation (DUF1610 family)
MEVQCSKCGEIIENRRNYSKFISPVCYNCKMKRNKEWQLKNKEKLLEYNKNYYRKNLQKK